MSNKNEKLIRVSLNRKRDLILSGILLLLIVFSLKVSAPVETALSEVRDISVEEEQSVISVFDQLSRLLPRQSVTLQNWMNKIQDGQIELEVVRQNLESLVKAENGKLLFSERFFESDSVTQQASLSRVLGMTLTHSFDGEIAFSRE